MQLQFLGATGTVTGSKYLLSIGKRHFLIDCGLFQGLKLLRLRNWHPLPIKPREIEAVVLTHAHIDHSGYLPLLVKNGFKGPVYVTPPTRRLCEVLLPDSGHLQEEDADFANRHRISKHHPALPLYTEADAHRALEKIEPVAWGKKVVLSKHDFFQFIPAGHILGASFVQFQHEGRVVTFSGDLGRPRNLVMKPPVRLERTDYLIVESTYGNRTHPKEDPGEALGEMVRRAVARGGTVLIPAFAVGRAQEVLYLLSRLKRAGRIPDVPIYLNSPMAVEATRIFCDYVGEHLLTEQDCQAMCDAVQFVTSVEESKQLNTRKEPAVIISASGMATGGRVIHHLKFLLPEPKNLVLFVGFQAAGTRGEALVDGAEQIKIHGEHVPVRAEIASLATLSAHADANEILGWLRQLAHPPKMTFVTHGEPLASEALRKRIEEELRWPCDVPDYLETFKLT